MGLMETQEPLLEIPNDTAVYGSEIAMFWRKNDVVYIRGKKVKRSLKNVEEFSHEIKKLVGNEQVYFVADFTLTQPYSKSEKELLRKNMLPLTKAMAIVSATPMGKMLGHTILVNDGLSRQIPMREFDSAKEAEQWINEMRGIK